MSKKTRIAIIIALAVVLAAGLALIFFGPSPFADSQRADGQQQAQVTSEPPVSAADAPSAEQSQESASTGDTGTGATEDPDEYTGETSGIFFPEATGVEAPQSDELTYLEYHNLSATEQKAFINTFESYDAFFAWHDAAKKAYEESLIEIDNSSTIDLGEIVGGE